MIIDLSHHNTVVNWSHVAQNIDGAIIRMGYRGYSAGTLAYDKKYKEYKKACEDLNIPHSFYFFPCSISVKEAEEEADFIINELKNRTYPLAYPVFLDSEVAEVKKKSGRADSLSVAERTKYLKIICDKLQNNGIPAGIYASKSWLYNNLDMGELPYTVWVAEWNSKCTYKGSYSFWQYTDRGQLVGINGYVDFSERCDFAADSCPYAAPILTKKKGSTGEGVKWIQCKLNRSGAALKIDGIYGSLTESAVLTFQKKVFEDKKEWDGIVGKKTRNKLKEY